MQNWLTTRQLAMSNGSSNINNFKNITECILYFNALQSRCYRITTKPNISSTRFSGLRNTSNRARMALWDVQYIYFRLTQTSDFNTPHPFFFFCFLEHNEMSKMKREQRLQ